MKFRTLALVAAGLMAASAAFAGEMVTANPVNNKPLSMRVFARPLVLVGTYDENGKADFSVIDRGGVLMQDPDQFGLGIKKSRATAHNIDVTKAFTIAFPDATDADQMAIFDYMGNHSHAKTPDLDKVAATGMKIAKSDVVNAPVPEGYGLVLHCDLSKVEEGGKMNLYVGDVKKVEADKKYFDAEGNFTLPNVLYYSHAYAKPGEIVGKVGELGAKFDK